MDGTKMGPKIANLVILEDHRPKKADMGPKSPRRRRLTATQITGFKSQPLPYDVQDPDCPGLLLHIAARLADGSPGAKSWQWRYYFLDAEGIWELLDRSDDCTITLFRWMTRNILHDSLLFKMPVVAFASRAARSFVTDGSDKTAGMLCISSATPLDCQLVRI